VTHALPPSPSQEWLQRYLHLHYPDVSDPENVPRFLPADALDFPRKCADVLISVARDLGVPTTRALDLGCVLWT
jgi:hypothetical protein